MVEGDALVGKGLVDVHLGTAFLGAVHEALERGFVGLGDDADLPLVGGGSLAPTTTVLSIGPPAANGLSDLAALRL